MRRFAYHSGCLFKALFCFFLRSKSGYHHVDIFPEHRAFLAFSWDFGTGVARYFQFTVLPFGLSSAPFIFTKLLKSLETLWRSHGIPLAIFFNDGVGAGQLVEAANHNISSLSRDRILPVPVFRLIMGSLTGSLSLVFLGSDTLLTLIRGSFARPIAELKFFFSELVDICVALEESRFVHVQGIAFIVGQIVSLSPSCGTVSRIMTRYLHFIVNSRHS